MKAPQIRRGSCPRCNRRKIQQYVHGMPFFDAFTDEEGNVPDSIHFAGCVTYPGPSFDRFCDGRGLRWNSWLDSRLVFSSWRELRDYLEVGTSDAANDWPQAQGAAQTHISPFPNLDDPNGKVVVRSSITHKPLPFPFTHAEWQAALPDLFDAVLERDNQRFSTTIEAQSAGRKRA